MAAAEFACSRVAVFGVGAHRPFRCAPGEGENELGRELHVVHPPGMVLSPFDKVALAILERLESAVTSDDSHCASVRDEL